MRPSRDSAERFFNTNLKTSALPHQFQWRRRVSNVTFWKRTSLTTAPSCTLIPNTRLESRTTTFENSACWMSACVSVPIIMGVEDDERMQFETVTFSVRRTGVEEPRQACVLRQIASSAVMMVESEIDTLDVETISIPSALTHFSRSE